ncbi:MarR family transcriptional regulator [Nocardia sp. NPDC051030]|uniref:MarR family winged helix-turn-helix transcriptional regulator n=1 Tax=Nocardia sp. NPDC051030 TaxID=3155162 RepID=UPI0034336871
MDDSTALAALEELARQLRRTSQELDRALASCLGETSVARWHVLTAVSGGTGIPMSQIGEATVLSGASLTRLIDAMIADNLVHRKVDATDRRRVLVFPTRRGQLALQVMTRAITENGLDTVANPRITRSLTSLVDQVHKVEEAERVATK